MLPFLKPKQAGSIVSVNYKDGQQESEGQEGEHSPGILAAAEDLISAVHAKDTKGVADALKAHYEINDNFLSNPVDDEV